MTKAEQIRELEEKVRGLETKVKHLSNELHLTREEYEDTSTSYFELYSQMEQEVEKRSEELKELQKVLELKGRELQVMLDLSPGMIFFTDARQRYIRVNKSFAEQLGIPISKIIGKTFAKLSPGNSAQEREDNRYVLQTGNSILNKEGALELPDGRIPVLMNKIPYKDIDGNVVGIIGFALDLTEIKRAEREKEELQTQLLQAQKMEAIGTLAGGIAHDFNNLLMVIGGNAELLRQEVEASDIATEHRFGEIVEMILKACNRAGDVTSQVLTISRRGVYNPTALRLDDIIEETIALLRETIDRRITVSTEMAPGLYRVEADQSQMHQVIMNLCTNAVDAMPAGGELKISARNVTLDEGFVRRFNAEAKGGEYLQVRVSDTGGGIDEETMQHIFEAL